MFRKISTFLILLLALTVVTSAQQRYMLKQGGKLINSSEIKMGHMQKFNKMSDKHQVASMLARQNPMSVMGTADTLSYRDAILSGGSYTNFGYFGQDVMLTWFVAPTDLNINAIAYATSDQGGGNIQAEMKIVKVNWSEDELKNAGETRWGYYPADNNGLTNMTAFEDNADRTGDWVDASGTGASAPFGADLWSDGGMGAPTFPVYESGVVPYQWVEMSLLGFSPSVKKGEIFGVVIKNDLTDLDQVNTDNRLGLVSAGSDVTNGIQCFKFYGNGRAAAGDLSDAGWWSRNYTWDMAAAVELTGDLAPTISDITSLPTTLSTADRTVDATIVDINPSGGQAGVASATLQWSTDGTTFTDVAMTANGDVYSGTIPGQQPGTEVTYQITATDVNGNTSTSNPNNYTIFQAHGGTLVVFNGYTTPTGYPQSYYFSTDGGSTFLQFDHDVWSYGPLTKELVDYYTNVVEICANGPNAYNNDVIQAWLQADSKRNYALFGQEWLGANNDFTDQDYAAGTFEYDILGVKHSYNDVSYDGAGQTLPTKLTAIEGTTLGGPIYTKFQTLGADSLQYNPTYEVGDYDNWIDGFDIVDGNTVDMTAETRGIGGNTEVREVNVLAHHELTAGNKIVFGSFDPISIDTYPDYTNAKYFWFGSSEFSPQMSTMEWFGYTTDVKKDNNNIPFEFNLSQNYPNPFNPSTNIKFSIPQTSKVVLKVYDMLGREVATLVNATKDAGNYSVNFDASNLASGLYVYTISAGNFNVSKKMMLLK